MSSRVSHRVALDVSAIPSDPRGAGRYAVELVRALDRRGRVELVLLARRDDGRRWRSLAAGADVRPVVPSPRPARLLWEQLLAPGRAASLGVDLWHGPHYTMPERAHLPRVVTVHDLTFFDHPEWHERWKVPVFRRAVRQAAAGAAAVVCVSGATAERLRILCPPRGSVHVIPHGVDHDRFTPDADAADDRAALEALGVHGPYLAFLGTMEPRKNVPALVRAFDELAGGHPDVRLVLAGGQGWGAGDIDAAVAASPYRSRIVRTGYVPDASVPALLRGAAAVVYPAWEEGFGLPVLEALACGTPVVTSEGSVMEEVAEGAALGVAPGDVGGLAQALAAVLAGGPEQARRRQHGLAVARRHSWDAAAAAHEAVYAEVAASGR